MKCLELGVWISEDFRTWSIFDYVNLIFSEIIELKMKELNFLELRFEFLSVWIVVRDYIDSIIFNKIIELKIKELNCLELELEFFKIGSWIFELFGTWYLSK